MRSVEGLIRIVMVLGSRATRPSSRLLGLALLPSWWCCLARTSIPHRAVHASHGFIWWPQRHVLRCCPPVRRWHSSSGAEDAPASPQARAREEEDGKGSEGQSMEAMMQRARQRLAAERSTAELMTQVRKEKHRRHKRRVEAKLRVLGEGERAERKARAQLVDQWLADVFAIDEGRPVPLTGLPPRLRVAIDLDYDETESMHKSLGRQLSYVYGMMRREADAAGGAACVPSLHLTSATPQMMEVLQFHGGQAWRVHRHEAPVFSVFHGPDLVYLSPDSSNTLTRVDPTKVYVVGGLVDRVIRKGRSLVRASSHGVATARLPLKEVFTQVPGGAKVVSSPCLAIDRVVHILVRAYQHQLEHGHDSGNSVEVALKQVLLPGSQSQEEEEVTAAAPPPPPPPVVASSEEEQQQERGDPPPPA